MRESETAVAAYALAMRLGDIKRATFHPDGQTHETDTTHTVGLQLVVLALMPHLGLGAESRARLLSYALVHDLCEAYAGDVNTVRPLGPEERAAKDAREAEARERIRADLPLVAGWHGDLARGAGPAPPCPGREARRAAPTHRSVAARPLRGAGRVLGGPIPRRPG